MSRSTIKEMESSTDKGNEHFEVQEVIYVAANKCKIYDPKHGNELREMIKGELNPKTLASICDHYLIGAAKDDLSLKVTTFSKKINSIGSFCLPGIVSALSATSCGTFVIAGIGTHIYVWRVDTGELLCNFNKHSQEITCIRLSSDDSHVLTAGKDGHVLVWLLADLVAVNQPIDNKGEPRFFWNHHAADVTDIHITTQNHNARVATVSADMSCRLYELSTGVLITSVFLEKTPTAVTMDTLENFLFIGDNTGSLYKINLFERLARAIYCCERNNSNFKIHDTEIVSLTVSFDGSQLVSADQMCVKVFDILSLTCNLKIDVEGKISNAFIALKPAALTDDTLQPPMKIVYFQKQPNLSQEPRLKTLRPEKRTLSAMQPISFGLDYNHPSMVKYADVNQSTAVPSASFYAIVEGDSIPELVHTNNQLYSTVLNIALDEVGAADGLDTDELDMENQQL